MTVKKVFILFAMLYLGIYVNAGENSDPIPKLNEKIIRFVNTHVGKRVGDGQCWSLASAALNAVNANWDHEYKFGREINPLREPVFSGDIIQFEDVTIKYREKNTLQIERYSPQHTAIIYRVKDNGNYTIAHQNVNGVMELMFSELHLNAVIRGTYKIFRPELSNSQ